MRRLFVDTSAWYAYVNARDPDHEAVSRLLKEFDGRLLTSNFVFDETLTLCLHRLGHRTAARVGQALLDVDTVDLVRITPEDEQRAWMLFLNRADKVYSFTDCTSFALLRRMGLEQAAALDDDFRREGFDALPRP